MSVAKGFYFAVMACACLWAPVAAHGQTVSGHGGSNANMQLGVIQGQINSLIQQLNSTRTDLQTTMDNLDKTNDSLNKFNTCQAKGMFYGPSSPVADSDGCYSVIGSKKRTIVSQELCVRGGVHDMWAKCPNGYSVLACSGGPGDQDESHEGWYVEPVTAQNSCHLVIGNPACVTAEPWTHTHLFAYCIEN